MTKDTSMQQPQVGNRKMQALKFLNTGDLISNDLPTYEKLKDHAKKALISSDLRDIVRYYDFVKQLTTDIWPEEMNPNATNFEPDGNVYGLSKLTDLLVQTTNQFPKGQNVEFGAIITGSNNFLLDQFTLPKILGIDSTKVGLFNAKISRCFDTLTMLALLHSDTKGSVLGIFLNAVDMDINTDNLEYELEPVPPLGKQNLIQTPGYRDVSHNDLFIEVEHLILPIGMRLSDYLTTKQRKTLGLSEGQQLSNEELKDLLQQSSNTITTSIRNVHKNVWEQYTLLQENGTPENSFDIDVYGTNISWHPTNAYYKRVLGANQFVRDQFKNGVFYDIHLHNAYTDQEIEMAHQRGTAIPEMLKIVGRDIHMYPTPSDIMNTVHISHQLQDFLGIDSVKIGGAILSLTEEY